MATRAKALRQFAKKYFNLDLVGMSETAVLKDMLKKEYNIDAVGNSVVSVLMNAAGDDGGGEAGTLELTPSTVGTRSISYFPTEGDLPCSFSIFNIWTYFDGLTYNGNYVDIYTASEDPTFSYTVKDGIYDTESESWYIPHECGDTSIHTGDKKDVEFTVKYKGATATAVVECSIAVSQ